MVFITTAYPSLTLGRGSGLATILWVVILVIFFPLIGWGFLGFGVSPELIVASLTPHVLFVVFLWGLARVLFKAPNAAKA